MKDSKKMSGRKIETFLSKLTDLVEALPSQESKDKTDKELATLIHFLSEFREKMSNVPTVEEVGEISSTIERLILLVRLAEADPFLSRSLGLSPGEISASPRRQRLTVNERNKAKEIATQIKNLSPQELSKKFEDGKTYTIALLKQIANEVGVRVSSRATRTSIIEQISKHLSNLRGYEYLRTGKMETHIT